MANDRLSQKITGMIYILDNMVNCPDCDTKPDLIFTSFEDLPYYHVRCPICEEETRGSFHMEESISEWNMEALAENSGKFSPWVMDMLSTVIGITVLLYLLGYLK